MVKDFEPSLYKDEYQVKLREIIEQKIAGKDITASAPEVQVNAIDIMEALKQKPSTGRSKKMTDIWENQKVSSQC